MLIVTLLYTVNVVICTVTCEHPLFNQSVGSSLYTLEDSYETVHVGTVVFFNCSQPGEVLIGSNSSKCTERGYWEPDPNQTICKGINTTMDEKDRFQYYPFRKTLDLTHTCDIILLYVIL